MSDQSDTARYLAGEEITLRDMQAFHRALDQARGFGTNQHGAEIARIDYCLHAARACSLRPEHIFLPDKKKR